MIEFLAVTLDTQIFTLGVFVALAIVGLFAYAAYVRKK